MENCPALSHSNKANQQVEEIGQVRVLLEGFLTGQLKILLLQDQSLPPGSHLNTGKNLRSLSGPR